jgi:non-heme Fe2+,alpha-ketoglutarate-dependent halogenase
MGKFLSQQQIDQFHQQGFLSPVDVMSEDEALSYAERLYQAELDFPDALNAENRNNAHLAFKFLDEIAFHPIILDAVEDLIGADFSLWGSVLFIKEPQSSHFVSWHQDATYMGITPHNFITPWLALTPSNRQTGCMSMLPASHLDEIHSHTDTFNENNILTRGQEVAGVDESAAVDLILKPGQMSLHHATIIHGSQPNRSGNRRIGFALQGFMPATSKQALGENYWLPVRGQCSHPDMVELHRPEFDMAPAAVEQRELTNLNWSNILYHGASKKRAY